MTRFPILIEAGSKRTFACAVDWPGLARSGRTEDAAIEALLAAMPRYAPVAAAAGLSLEPVGRQDVEVVERIPGNATTDFGAPGVVAELDRRPLSAADASRDAALLNAAWEAFESAAATAPEELRKGPRGGGRNRSKIVDHVHEAERGYAAAIGLRETTPVRRAQEELRAEFLAVLGRPSDGTPLAGKRWPSRYAARRIAWHALDHAWEIQDRGGPAEA